MAWTTAYEDDGVRVLLSDILTTECRVLVKFKDTNHEAEIHNGSLFFLESMWKAYEGLRETKAKRGSTIPI